MRSKDVVVTHVLGWSARPGKGPAAAQHGAYVSRCTKFASLESRCKTSFAWAIADELSLTFELAPTDSNEKPPEGLGPFCSPFSLTEAPGSGPIFKDTRRRYVPWNECEDPARLGAFGPAH